MLDFPLSRPALTSPWQPLRPTPPLPEIKGFIETSFLDWPGQVAAVLFLPGCNFACPFCHNYGLVSDPAQYQTLALEEIMARLEGFAGWIDGVVISGGEPTLHPGLAALAARIKAAGLKVKLDTNGHRPQILERLLADDLLDMVAMDLKAPLEPLAYRRAAGRPVDTGRLARSIDLIIHSGVEHLFRSTIAAGWHGPAELARMAAALEGCAAWRLQAMDLSTAWSPGALSGLKPYGGDQLAELQARFGIGPA